MRLIQIPFSHNCIKVRRALELKGLAYETENISPVDREPVRRASGQGLVPVLVDDGVAVWDSTAILLHLEDRYPQVPLLPSDPRLRAECLVLEDWADGAFMALTRRLAYWNTLATRGALESLFFPGASAIRRAVYGPLARRAVRRRFRLSREQHRRDLDKVRRLSGLAAQRLRGRAHLVGDRASVADVALAAMTAPLWAAGDPVSEWEEVRALLEWGESILGEDLVSTYRRPTPEAAAR